MKTSSNSLKVKTARIFYRLRYAIVKGLGLLIQIAPARLFLMEALSFCVGLWNLAWQAEERRFVAGSAVITGSKTPGWLYVLKYFIQSGRNSIWSGTLFFEAQHSLNKYLSIEGRETLEESLKRGKGAVLLGAHYGPKLHLFLFSRMKIDVCHLVDRDFYNRCGSFIQPGTGDPMNKKVRFFREFWPCLTVRGSEKKLVRHLEKGGAVSMLIDFPNRSAGNPDTDFFGLPMQFYKFPFKLALEYKAPVFFYFLNRTGKGGYRLFFVSAGAFSTPEEGAAKYASFLQSRITASPFLWHMLPSLPKWLRGKSV